MPTISYIYSVPYVLFFFYLLSFWGVELYYISKNKNPIISHIAVLFGFLFFVGLRGFINTDWSVYYLFFENIPSLLDDNWSSVFSGEYESWDKGFVLYSVLCKTISENYFVWSFINLSIDLYILSYFFNKNTPKYYALSFIFFYAFSGLLMEVNLARNAKSIMLFLISIKYLEERRIVPYLFLNTIGFLFHVSSILYFPLCLLLNRKWSKKLIIIVFCIGNILFISQVEYIKPIIVFIASFLGKHIATIVSLYLQSDMFSSAYGISIGYIERAVSFGLIYINQDKLTKENKNNVIFINAFYIYIFIYLFFSEWTILLERLPILFVFSYWILYPKLFGTLNRNSNKFLFVGILVIYVVLKLASSNSTILLKYDNLIFGIESFESRLQTFRMVGDNIIDK